MNNIARIIVVLALLLGLGVVFRKRNNRLE